MARDVNRSDGLGNKYPEGHADGNGLLRSSGCSETKLTVRNHQAMAGLPPCIYCGSTGSPREKREHVIPQAFGMFENNWTLDCVCDECNKYFGDKLELILGRDSSESLLRMKYGLKPAKEAKDLLNRRMTLTIEAEGFWKSARAFVAPTLTGNSVGLLPFPQAGFKLTLEPAFTWIAEADLNEASVAPYLPKGTEYRVVGPSQADIQRVVDKLKALGFPFREQSYTEQKIGGDDNQVTFAAEAMFDIIVQRAIAKSECYG